MHPLAVVLIIAIIAVTGYLVIGMIGRLHESEESREPYEDLATYASDMAVIRDMDTQQLSLLAQDLHNRSYWAPLDAHETEMLTACLENYLQQTGEHLALTYTILPA